MAPAACNHHQDALTPIDLLPGVVSLGVDPAAPGEHRVDDDTVGVAGGDGHHGDQFVVGVDRDMGRVTVEAPRPALVRAAPPGPPSR